MKPSPASADGFSTDLGISAFAILVMVRLSALPLLGEPRQ
jgi:hypothetical protein